MSKHAWELVVGIVMIVGGLVLFTVFADVETPVVGLRQTGLVIAVLGAVEIVAALWSRTRSRRRPD